MDDVNQWLSVMLGVLGVLAGVAAMLRTTASWVVRNLDARIDATLDTKLDAAFNDKLGPIHRQFEQIDSRFEQIDRRLDGIDSRLDSMDARIDRLDAKVDHIAEVVDLRLRPLEQDMALVKQHLLGTPAA